MQPGRNRIQEPARIHQVKSERPGLGLFIQQQMILHA
jgi:hypothetical protein